MTQTFPNDLVLDTEVGSAVSRKQPQNQQRFVPFSTDDVHCPAASTTRRQTFVTLGKRQLFNPGDGG